MACDNAYNKVRLFANATIHSNNNTTINKCSKYIWFDCSWNFVRCGQILHDHCLLIDSFFQLWWELGSVGLNFVHSCFVNNIVLFMVVNSQYSWNCKCLNNWWFLTNNKSSVMWECYTFLKGATSRFVHLEKFSLNFSSLSFVIHVNLLHH